MRSVEIDGKKYVLKNGDEVSYGAEKKLERAQFNAQMAMLSDSDVKDLARKTKADAEGEVDEAEFMRKVLAGATKEAILNSHDAAITPEEQAIILSLDISRERLMKMPSKVVKELAKYAMEELGTVEDFSEASSTDTK
jgi:hypothetical protein